MRKSSIHFKPVANIRFAVSHSERTDLSEPAYLLPKEHQLNNIVVTGSLDEGVMAELFIQQKSGMTGQAKARGSSPFWEGVVVLPNTDGQEQSSNLQSWKKEYEKATGHKVLHMAVHLDEGYIDELGKPQYNPHAHVIVSRMDGKNRVINLDRKQLAKVQDLTAETLQMERGSTLAERHGKRGRAHIPHRDFRAQADEKRLELGKEKGQAEFYGRLIDTQNTRSKNQAQQLKAAQLEAATATQQLAQLKEQYRLDREAMKATGEATQRDYQALKKTHEQALTDLKAQAMAVITPLREEVKTMKTHITQLEADNAKLAEDKARFAEMANTYQAEKAKGTPAHLIEPIPEVTKTAQEPSKPHEAPIHPPATGKELEATFKEFREGWLSFAQSKNLKVVDLDTAKGDYYGPILGQDDVFAVQKTGTQTCAIHLLADLSASPDQDNPKLRIRYRDGVGQVSGNQPKHDRNLGL